MLFFYLLANTLAVPAQFKSFDLMFLTDSSRMSECEKLKTSVSTVRTSCQSVKPGDTDYNDCQTIYKMYDMQCVTGDNINDELKKVSPNLDMLMLLIDRTTSKAIDFNNLPEQMVVLIAPEDESVPSSANVLEIVKKMTSKKVSKSQTDRKDIKTKIQPINIAGGIKNKVSSLFITPYSENVNSEKMSISLKISQSALDVDNLFLDEVTVDSGSESIDVNYLYVMDNVKLNMQKTKAKNVVQNVELNLEPNGIISFNFPDSTEEATFPNGENVVQGSISIKNLEYKIVPPTSTSIISSLNITIADLRDSAYEIVGVNNKIIPKSKEKIIVIGNKWTNKEIPANFQIIVTFDDSKYELNISGLDESLQSKVVRKNPYQYTYKPYSGPSTGDKPTTKNYGYIFDLSDVSSNIVVKYVRSDQEDKGMQTAIHGTIKLEGSTEFTVSVYATIEGQCTDGFIAKFTAEQDSGSGYPKRVVTNDDFSECSGDVASKKYGYIFDLSDVSSNIVVKYVRSDQEDKGMQTAKHGTITLEGNTAFTITVYATIEGQCTDGYIAQFTAKQDSGSGYPKLVVSDDHFSECSGGNASGDDTSNKYKSFDLMLSIRSEKTSDCDEMKSKINNLRKLCKTVSSDDNKYEECQILERLKDVQCSLQDKVNDGLSNLKSDRDLLIFIITDDPTEPIDFNKLKGERVVILTSASDTIYSGNLLASLKNIISLKKSKEPAASRSFKVELVGNIRQHVSFLLIGVIVDKSQIQLNIKKAPLDVENFFASDCYQTDDSMAINSTYLYDAKGNYENHFNEKTYAKQLLTTFVDPKGTNPTESIEVTFGKESISFNKIIQPLSYSEMIGVVSEATTYKLSASSDAVFKSLNITQYNFQDSFAELQAVSSNLLEDKKKIKFIDNLGNVKLPDDFSITISCDKSKYELDKSSLPEILKGKVEVKDIPKYQNKKQEESDGKSGLPLGAIIGIVVAAVVVVGVAIFLGVWFGVVKKKRKDASSNEQNDSRAKNQDDI